MTNDTSSYFQIKGKINIKDKTGKGDYTVEVLYFNSSIISFNIKNGKNFMLLVKKDSPYTLRISKRGFVSRSICINTSLSDTENRDIPYTFSIETDLIAASQAMRMNEEALQMPAALISYNKDTKDFDYNKNYSAFVQQKIYGD